MQDGARLFAYSTWVLMISVGIIVFTHSFFQFMENSIAHAVMILLAFGFIYFNLTFAAVKRYIKKVPAPTQTHLILAVIIFLPPFLWILTINESFTANDLLLILILILAIISASIFGNRAGIKARYEYVQKLKEAQKKARKP